MIKKSYDIVGEEKVGGGRYEYSTAVGGRNAATSGVVGVTSFVPNYWPYGRLDTELSGGMAPASSQAQPPSFDRRRIGNSVAVDGVGSPGRVEELDYVGRSLLKESILTDHQCTPSARTMECA